MVIVSEKSVKRMIEDVAPKVERLTGWDPHLEGLEVRIIRRDQYWEEVILPTFSKLGIDTEVKTEKGEKSVKTAKLLVPYLILGQYEPLTGRMLVLPDNLRFGTNESGLTTTLGHELVHRCQFINNPRFAKMYSKLLCKATGKNAFEEDSSEDKNVKPYLQAYMTLVEGDASFVEEQLKKMFYQDAKNKTSWMSNLLGFTMMFAGIADGDKTLLQKAKQYSEGKKRVRAFYETGGRNAVNSLYNLDELGLGGIFS